MERLEADMEQLEGTIMDFQENIENIIRLATIIIRLFFMKSVCRATPLPPLFVKSIGNK